MSIISPTHLAWNQYGFSSVVIDTNTLILDSSTNAVWWNKFENNTSDIGVDTTNTGVPVYAAAKFGNGFNNTTGANHLDLDMTVDLTAYRFKGSLDFWHKPANLVDWNDAARYFSHPGAAAGTVAMGLGRFGGGLWFFIGDNGVGAAGARALMRGVPPVMNAGVWYHFQLCWDKDAATKCWIYIDGNLLGGALTENVAWASGDWNTHLSFGALNVASPTIGIFDNPRFWNDSIKLTAAQRNAESPLGFAASGTAIIIIGLEGRRRIKEITADTTLPTGTSVSLKTKVSDIKPTETEAEFNDSDGYPNKNYALWGDTVPSNQVIQTSGAKVKGGASAMKYVELELGLATTDSAETPIVNSVTFDTETDAIQVEEVNQFEVTIG